MKPSDIAHLLNEVLHLVAADLAQAGYKDRVDAVDDLIGVGEFELAWSTLCSNLYEFDIPITARAYRLLVRLWSALDSETARSLLDLPRVPGPAQAAGG